MKLSRRGFLGLFGALGFRGRREELVIDDWEPGPVWVKYTPHLTEERAVVFADWRGVGGGGASYGPYGDMQRYTMDAYRMNSGPVRYWSEED